MSNDESSNILVSLFACAEIIIDSSSAKFEVEFWLAVKSFEYKIEWLEAKCGNLSSVAFFKTSARSLFLFKIGSIWSWFGGLGPGSSPDIHDHKPNPKKTFWTFLWPIINCTLSSGLEFITSDTNTWQRFWPFDWLKQISSESNSLKFGCLVFSIVSHVSTNNMPNWFCFKFEPAYF